jgi:8-oxo-dGTP diphosphatase
VSDTKDIHYEKPGVTIDTVIFTIVEDRLEVLLVKRADVPFQGSWSLPGGFILQGESLEAAVQRILLDKAGMSGSYLEQLYTFGQPDRDPRSRVITVAYLVLLPWKRTPGPLSPKVSGTEWTAVHYLPKLAFDHNQIVLYAVERLRAKAGYSNIGIGLLPDKFRLSDLQRVYEVILGHDLDKRNFRKKMHATGLLEETGEKEIIGAHRPAMLFRFKEKKVVNLD